MSQVRRYKCTSGVSTVDLAVSREESGIAVGIGSPMVSFVDFPSDQYVCLGEAQVEDLVRLLKQWLDGDGVVTPGWRDE